jgi:hypothetical protein
VLSASRNGGLPLWKSTTHIVSVLSLHLGCMQLKLLSASKFAHCRRHGRTGEASTPPPGLPCGFLLNTEDNLLVANHQTEIAIVEKKPVRQSFSRNFFSK